MLISKYREERVVLVNLSQRGCCVEVQDPPAAGDVVLRWEQFDAHGEISWRTSGLIGIRFSRAVPYEWIIATRQLGKSTLPPFVADERHLYAKALAEGKRFV